MVPFERALVSFYRSSIVTFPLSLRVSEILPLLFSSMPLSPTPPLVSPKFPHVPLGTWGNPPWGDPPEKVDRLLATKSEGVGLIVRAISFQDFQTYVITIHQRHRQMDRRTTCDQKTAHMH